MSRNEALPAWWRRSRLLALGLSLLVAATVLQAAERTTLPDSLGQWYKPANKRQVWLHTMFAMRRELQAVREYAQQRDGAYLAKWSAELAGHYRKLPQMVPEWRDETDLSLIEALERRVEAGDFAGVLRAADRLERDCRSCHRQYQALAAVRYRWPRFDGIRIDDGHGGDVPYRDYMETLSNTVNRIKIASEDDRWDLAQASLGELRGQLDALGEGCRTCHADAAPRERILGSETATTLGQLEQAILARDNKAAGRRLGEAAVQTCARCHGVHRLLSGIQRQLFD